MYVMARTNEAEDQAELVRLIEREKKIFRTRPLKMVLMHDFFNAVRCPVQSEPHPAFAQIFGYHAQNIGKSLSKLIRRGEVCGGLILYEELEAGDAKKIIFDTAREYVDERIALAKQTRSDVEMFDGYSHPDFPVITEVDCSSEDARMKRIKEFANITRKWAYSLEDIVTAMDMDGLLPFGLGSRIAQYERRAMKYGEGEDVLALWQRINALDDYRSLFEDVSTKNGRKKTKNLLVGAQDIIRGLAPSGIRGWRPA